MSGEERKALSFVAVLLGLSVLARAANRPEPIIVAGASAADIQSRIDQNQQVRQQAGKPSKPVTTPQKTLPKPVPAWRRPGDGVVIDNRTAAGQTAPVNVNRATAAQLDELPGVSPAVAERIIEYRTARGMISSMEQLDSVKGIGPALLAKLKPLVRFR